MGLERMRNAQLHHAVQFLAYELIALWFIFGTYLLIFDKLDYRFETYGVLAFWGFLAPVFTSAILLETRIEVDALMLFLGLLITVLYLGWFQVSGMLVASLAVLLAVAAILSSYLTVNRESWIAGFLQRNLEVIAALVVILIAIWGFWLGLDYQPVLRW